MGLALEEFMVSDASLVRSLLVLSGTVRSSLNFNLIFLNS